MGHTETVSLFEKEQGIPSGKFTVLFVHSDIIFFNSICLSGLQDTKNKMDKRNMNEKLKRIAITY